MAGSMREVRPGVWWGTRPIAGREPFEFAYDWRLSNHRGPIALGDPTGHDRRRPERMNALACDGHAHHHR
jgi:hypothetical protein